MMEGAGTSDHSLTARFKETLSAQSVFPVALRSQLSYQAFQLRVNEVPKSDKRCPQCYLKLSSEGGTLQVFLEKKRKKRKPQKRSELLARCLGCQTIIRCGMLPQLHKEEDFLEISLVADLKQNVSKFSKVATPANTSTPPVKQIGSSMKKRSGARKLERMIALEKSANLESPKTSLSAFLSSIQ